MATIVTFQPKRFQKDQKETRLHKAKHVRDGFRKIWWTALLDICKRTESERLLNKDSRIDIQRLSPATDKDIKPQNRKKKQRKLHAIFFLITYQVHTVLRVSFEKRASAASYSDQEKDSKEWMCSSTIPRDRS